MHSMKSAAFVAIGLWIIILIYLSSQLFASQAKGFDHEDRLAGQLVEALDSLKELRRQNEELQKMMREERREHEERRKDEQKSRERLLESVRAVGKKNDVIVPAPTAAPAAAVAKTNSDPSSQFTMEHEVAQRQLDKGVWEIFYYLHKKMKSNEFESIRNRTESQLISLLASSAQVSSVGGASEMRKSQLQTLTDRIQTTIDRLQNPSDCSKARTLLCNLDKECGFGCQLHHVAYCFVTAFGAGRMMVLKEDGQHWRYSQKGWTGAFLPITKCSHKEALGSDQPASFSPTSTARVVSLGIVDGLANKPEHLPLSFPKGLSDELLALHSNPPVYFISQFIWYLMRSNTDIASTVKEAADQIPFGNDPIVGLQVRRTDKVGTEAAFHSVEEYMEWAEIWFRVEERKRGKVLKRKVYIASDDPEVVPETKKKYTQYEVFGDISIANTAQLGSRYTDASLHGVVTDIQLLSRCDYLVCTFSSQVCRMGYELMQVRQGDAGERFHSLDDLYYYGGQFAHEQLAVEEYKAESASEIDLLPGDVIGIAGNHWDGWSKGQNRRTGKTGLYPSYKAIEKWRIVDFSLFN